MKRSLFPRLGELLLSRRGFIAAIATSCGGFQAGNASILRVSDTSAAGGNDAGGNDAGDDIEPIAKAFVAHETKAENWPFKAPDSLELRTSKRKVWSHYFTPLPLSLDDLEPRKDYYHSAMRREGEAGKYSEEGGYLRDRPLSPRPWPTAEWRSIDAAIDLLRADRIGVDGFMLDIDWLGKDGQLRDITESLCSAADRIRPRLKIIAQPDMASLASQGVAEIAGFIRNLAAKHSSLYRLDDGRLVVAPFAPDMRSPDFWAAFKRDMEANGQPIALLPVMLDWGKVDQYASLAYGLSAWGVREPSAAQGFAEQMSTRSRDFKTWIMPIAPQDSRPNSSIFWEARNTQLFRTLWDAAISHNAPQVHLITWNDYSETTEIQPSLATQFVFYDLAAYYIAKYKLGHFPEILRDAIYYTHRRQIIHDDQAAIVGDRPMRRISHDAISNDVEMLAFLVSPATLEIITGGRSYRADVAAGLAELRAPADIGRPEFRIIRNQHAVVQLTSAWEITARPERDDFTYYGGSSTRTPTTESDNT